MSGLWLHCKFGFSENKQTKKNQCSVASMTTRWTRERGNQAQQNKKDIGRFKLSLDRVINSAHKFSCTHNAICIHVMCTVVTVHIICDLRELYCNLKNELRYEFEFLPMLRHA